MFKKKVFKMLELGLKLHFLVDTIVMITRKKFAFPIGIAQVPRPDQSMRFQVHFSLTKEIVGSTPLSSKS
jgi:hypothetical protein